MLVESTASEGAAPEVTSTEGAPAPTVVAPPEGVAPELWDSAAGSLKSDAVLAQLKELGDYKTSRSEIDATIVDAVDKVVFEADITLPDGTPVEFDSSDPLFAAIAQTVVESKIPTAYIKPLATAFARAQLEADEAAKAVAISELEKLGDKREDRLRGLISWMAESSATKSQLPAAEAKAAATERAQKFIGSLGTAEQVEFLEMIRDAFAPPNPGNDNPSAGGGGLLSGPNPGAVFFAQGRKK